jgi:hypothetical protein
MKPLALSTAEKGDLIKFLKALSGDPVIVDPPILPPYAVSK